LAVSEEDITKEIDTSTSWPQLPPLRGWLTDQA
jgi:hypothetical protein